MEEPVLFIEVLEGDQFRVNPLALEALAKYECNVKVVSVAGIYRSGKSSLMNWLRGRSGEGGFGVGSTTQRHTRGIWMIPAPEEESGESVTVLLDTEGIGSVETDSKYDARIFSLAILLSSTILFNAMGSIDENNISNLSFIAQLSSMIQTKAKEGEGTGDVGDASDFPYFVWVVRDFALELQDEDGDPITPGEYLELSLKATDGFDRDTLERNKTRHLMSQFFPERTCVTLVRPLVEEEELQEASTRAPDSLRPEFLAGLEQLKDIVYGKGQDQGQCTAASRASKMNGRMFGSLTASYVGAINGGGVPSIATAWESVSRQECELAADAALAEFTSSLGALAYPMDEAQLEESQRDCSKRALQLFDDRVVGRPNTVQKHRLELMSKMGPLILSGASRNFEHGVKAMQTVLKELLATKPAMELGAGEWVSAADVAVQRWEKFWAELTSAYDAKAVGPGKWDFLLQADILNNVFEEGSLLEVMFQQGYGCGAGEADTAAAALSLEITRLQRMQTDTALSLEEWAKRLATMHGEAESMKGAVACDEAAVASLDAQLAAVDVEVATHEEALRHAEDAQATAAADHARVRVQCRAIEDTKKKLKQQDDNLEIMRGEVRELSLQLAKSKGCCAVS